MVDQELLVDFTESYLKSVISEASGSLEADFNSFAAFGELGINSFQVLKIIKTLEGDFGTLPKSLLFENFTIHDLANYFVAEHGKVLSAKFAGNAPAAVAQKPSAQKPSAQKPSAQKPSAAKRIEAAPRPQSAPLLILEKDAYADPELGPLVRALYERHKIEGCVSRGTRKIAPNLFIGSAKRGYFNYGRSSGILMVYGYTGPADYFPELFQEIVRYCAGRGLQLNVLADRELPSVDGVTFSATPFGVLQRIVSLREFSLDGGPMRRLRYQVSKFQKSGECRTIEYRCGSDPETDRNIANVIDRWCETRTVVNPLVHDVKAEILAGSLGSEHRVFLTYLDEVLQNVILITGLCAEENGYLMDLEFYLPDMPLGGLEFAITQIIEILAREGCDLLSLGGTYGCKLEPSPNADPDVDRILDELRDQNIFNDAGNLQFKNKFRPENKSIYLCRPAGSGKAENVIDIIMMIADPDRMQTRVDEHHEAGGGQAVLPVASAPALGDRLATLAQFGFNPLNLPAEHVDFDLKTDSWAQLDMPAIDVQMRNLHGQLQQSVNVDDSLRSVFPFAHFVLTRSGQTAEHVFFKAWPRRGVVLQNLLFPSTIFHQIDKGFTPRELPHPEVFRLDSRELYKGNLAWDALQAQVTHDPSAIACVCVEVDDNAAGGYPVSLRHLREIRALLAPHGIPLVLDATRILENARFLIDNDPEEAGRGLWAVARDILSCADAVIGSLTKDFGVNKGGIVATNDAALFGRLQAIVAADGAGIDLVDRKLIALSLRNRKYIEASVARRMENVRLVWNALRQRDVPVVQPAGGHCVLVDVRRIAEFAGFDDPVASLLAWLYANTGVRAGAHNAGMQTHTALNDLVRIAIPIGFKREEIANIIDRLAGAFDAKVNIPEIVREGIVTQPFGGVHANYRLVQVHNPVAAAAPGENVPAEVVIDAEERRVPEESAKPRRTQDVAIIGMAGRYPKANNTGELWENLVRGRDCIEEMPADRYERRVQYGSLERYRGGFIDDIDKFDSLFFNISPREAEMLDPQERLFVEAAWEAIEDAGYYPEILAPEDGPRNIGVFVGAVWAMYQMLGVEEKHRGNPTVPNSFLWSVANRVSYAFNFSGPSLTVDTACSSSLTALHLACEAIRNGDCAAALVGGVNLDLHQARFDINHQGGALSPDGVCRTFGKGANGYVMGEGVGALLLKPLDQAVKDGDHIYGVIKSAVVNHGGRSGGYTVPNPKAQASLITAALEKANVPAATIGYVEAHGTGTALGDPVEITGLTSAFSAHNVDRQSCAIGSIKTNIGHLEAAAGIVSVSKVLLQMQHRQLVPSLHSAEPNEFIEFEKSPFYVVQQVEEWRPREVNGVRLPLRAGISSFGAGGSNAHVILEQYEMPQRDAVAPERPLIFPLSARTEEALREAAGRLVAFLGRNDVDLSDAAFTLQQGRKTFEHRAAIIATTREELLERLALFLDGKRNQDIIAGQAKGAEGVMRFLNRRQKQEFIRMVAQDGDPRQIAGMWVEGIIEDWQGHVTAGRRISLPTYPFADRRHWVSGPSPAPRVLQQTSGVHPIIDSNESTFERQLFKKTFHERDFFIYDHHVSDIATLPGVAYLEFARKAGELAAGRPVRKIKNILWISPITVQNGASKEVFLELKPNRDTVQFEVFSEGPAGSRIPHSQGTLLYATPQELAAAPEFVDLNAVRARCAKVIDGATAYPLFKAHGLNLGPSFQVLQDVYKSDSETLGALKLPEFRRPDLESMLLHPSLVDGSLQAGMAAQLGGQGGEMMVPFSIGEVEILAPLQSTCYSYITRAREDETKKQKSSVVFKSDATIVDENGRVLVKIRDSVGVPLRDVHKKSDEFAPLYYSYDWEPAPLPAATQTAALMLFTTEDLASDEAVIVRPGAAFETAGPRSYTIDPHDKEDFVRLFESLAERGIAVENVCFAWPANSPEALDASLEQGVYSFLYLCQALIKQKLENSVQLLYAYAGQQPQHEAVGGFVNTLRLEHPKLLCKTVEVHDGGPFLDAIATEFAARTQDATSVRYAGGERFVRKLKAFELEEIGDANAIRENAVVLITGGAGGLGLIFAEYLTKEHKATVVLTGRSALTAEREARLDAIRKEGAEVVYLAADVANADDVRGLVAECKSRFGRINGVIHAAGVLRDSLVRNKTAEEMRAVLAPKVFGTVHLDECTKDEALDFFVTFSSLTSVKGNGGQSDYSFANHFMDSFAAGRELRRAQGARSGRTLSLNWSIWAEGGMKLDEQTEFFFRNNLGISPLSAATGCDALVRGIASGRSQFAVLEGNQEKVELAWGLRKKQAPAATQTGPAATATAGAADLYTPLLNDLSQIVMGHLKLEAGDVAHDKILLDLGYDSIGLTSFANAVNEKYQLDITPVLFFDYPSLGEIARHLSEERAEEIGRYYGGAGAPATAAPVEVRQAPAGELKINKGWGPPAATSVEAVAPQHRPFNEPIAIVGIAGVMPLSEDLDEFWDNLQNSRDLISVVPRDRWRWEDYFGDPLTEVNKSNSKWGGFMKEVDKFDPQFFGISAREAQMMDPQQRIFLQTVWKAVEDSGQKVSDLAGTKTGLFVGVATNDYLNVMSSLPMALDLHAGPGNSHSILANRVSFLLNLHGPSAPIDTACSSSLIALHRAVESIRAGSCEMAIVGGVHAMLSPGGHISFAMAGLMSSDGKCRSFDKGGNGYSRGEGCGAVFIKPLSMAEADGNHIYAVIKGTAENHGGRVAMLTAPNASAQSALLVEAYEKARVDPATVGYIECHGTGTGIGDSIEVQGMTRAFAELYKRNGKTPPAEPHVGLSCVKSNMGHLETAAGIASVLKVVLALQHKKIPATLHFEELNPYIKLTGTPFYIVDKLTEWKAPAGPDGAVLPRRAGVSAFGFGGANAHIVLEEYVAPPRPRQESHSPQLIVLSAKNPARLDAYIEAMLAYLDKNDVELADLAYTLQVGRDEMPERIAVVAASIDELKLKFRSLVKGGNAADCYRWKASTEARVAQGDLSAMAEAWVSGAKIDWHSLHASALPRRISAPTYPFAKERHWFTVPEQETATQSATESRLHPLVHTNASTLGQQAYRSLLTGREFFLEGPEKVFPGAVYLEMARAAVEASLPGGSPVVELEETIWGDPMVVGESTRATIALLTADDGQIHYEISSGGEEQEVVHCQGRVVLSERAAATSLNLDELRARMRAGRRGGAIVDVQLGDRECLARLSLPATAASERGYVLQPSVMTGAVQAAAALLTDGREAAVLPERLRRLRVLSPCTELMFAWVRNAQDGVDLDLADADGRVCVELRGLSFRAVRGQESNPDAQWLFGSEHSGVAVVMPAAEKIELFLRQEMALQLQKPIESIAPDVNYFDLGLTSLVIAHLVQKTSRVLGEDLYPSALLEYSDLRGVASYLAATYPAAIDALKVVRSNGSVSQTANSAEAPRPTLSRLPRKHVLPIKAAPPAPVIDDVVWEEIPAEEEYETVTF